MMRNAKRLICLIVIGKKIFIIPRPIIPKLNEKIYPRNIQFMLFPCFSSNAQQNDDEDASPELQLEPKASSSFTIDAENQQQKHLDLEEIKINNHQNINRRNKFERRKLEYSSPKWMPEGISLPFSLKVVFILICGTFFKFGNCCMPGYEGERASLRQYLGIEWSPGGLTKMDAEPPRFVRHSSELNCDFSNPDKCRWQNMPKRGFDSLDFYLFRKEDNTEFPILQIRPGPSKVPVGDQLLLTGDRKRQEQSAILLSHPIKCQNTTGRLTFTFWLYNGARIEVLVFEENNDEGLRILPEKPQVDCGTVQMNTECTVEIPPRDRPFRIAIRAYDIRHPEGSFVMLDSILYEAQFCRVSIEFGPDFHTEPLLTGANGEFVQSAVELNCAEFDVNCRWRNSGHGQQGVWKRAIGRSPPAMMLFNETGTQFQPKLPTAFLYFEEGNYFGPNAVNNFRMLSSDPIECAETSLIVLQFRIWSTKGIQLSCCLLDSQTQQIIGQCQPMHSDITPAPIQMKFNSDKQKFMFAIRVDSINSDFDNFVILDEFEVLNADGCGQLGIEAAQKGWLVDGGLFTAPMLSTFLNRPIHSAKDLNCDFAKRALNCQWANLERLGEGMSPWEIGSLGSGKNNKRISMPIIGDVALTRLDSANGSAVLLSEQIQCTHDERTTLTFRSWQSGGNIQLGVCIVRANSLEVLDCQNTNGAIGNIDGEQILVEIPRLDEPVRLAIRAESNDEQGGLLAVDDIQLEGNVCASTNAIAFAAGKSGYERIVHSASGIINGQEDATTENNNNGWHALPDENVCRLLSCNFNNEGNMCLFTSSRIASSVSMFRAYNQSAFAMLFTRSRVAMLESPLFHLNAPARLHFDFSIKKGPATLHICQDSIIRELDSCFAIFQSGETNGWKSDFVEVLPNDRKLYFITKMEGPGKATIQLDNLELTDVRNHRVC